MERQHLGETGEGQLSKREAMKGGEGKSLLLPLPSLRGKALFWPTTLAVWVLRVLLTPSPCQKYLLFPAQEFHNGSEKLLDFVHRIISTMAFLAFKFTKKSADIFYQKFGAFSACQTPGHPKHIQWHWGMNGRRSKNVFFDLQIIFFFSAFVLTHFPNMEKVNWSRVK